VQLGEGAWLELKKQRVQRSEAVER
jgi:hypothetical protein